jgi:Mrp family chromosome partitioning ATPase
MASALFDVAVAHTEETIRHASVAPPVLEPVQHIDSMATWNANSPALAQSYLCVVEEIDPKLWPAEVAAVNLPVEEPPTSKAGILPEVESTAPAVSQPISSLVEEVSSASGPSPTAPPPTIAPSTLEVQWEVDHFLYPAVTEQLLSSYPYFKQAGEKLLKATQAGMKVMAITGVGRQEGRTTLAICLARAAARAGLRVGLIDADFTSPALASQLGVEVEQGWEAVLRGSTTLAEIAVRAVEEGITLYPWLASGDAPAPQLSTPGVMEVVQQAATTNQLLLLDLGPWSATGLKKIVRLPFDAALVVRDLRSRELDDLLPIANWLHEAGVEAVGIAENFAPLS